MKKYPKLFDDLYTNLVAAGEAGGILDTILQRLAAYIEKSAKLKAKIKSAMMYPAIVLIVAVLVIAVIMVFVHSCIFVHVRGFRAGASGVDPAGHQSE